MHWVIALIDYLAVGLIFGLIAAISIWKVNLLKGTKQPVIYAVVITLLVWWLWLVAVPVMVWQAVAVFVRRRVRFVDHIEVTPDQQGYWLVTGDERAFPFGNAYWYDRGDGLRSQPAQRFGPQLIVYPESGRITTSDGCQHHGDLVGTPLQAPIVDILPTRDNGGYWLVGADGGVFTFGNAGFFGSLGRHPEKYGINWRALKVSECLVRLYGVPTDATLTPEPANT